MIKNARHIIKYIVGICIIIALYIILLMVGQAIPKDIIWDNVVKSYGEITDEGTYNGIKCS